MRTQMLAASQQGRPRGCFSRRARGRMVMPFRFHASEAACGALEIVQAFAY